MKTSFFAIVFFILNSASAYSDDSKLDPLLKHTLINKGILISKVNIESTLINVDRFKTTIHIISDDPSKTILNLKEMGYEFRVHSNILIGRTDLRDIPIIQKFSEVRYIGIATPKKLYLDKSIPFIKADLVHSAFRLPFPVTGKGVVLGITDTGLDYTHQDFISNDGDMRTKYIWYQDINPENKNSPPEYGYGDECGPERLNSKECPYKDIIGHGTHCCGIMGSDSKRYKGVAPEGVYIVAKSGTFENLVDGIEYILKRAESLKMPVVINMSLGGHYGPHDGNSTEEIAIADMLERGEAKGKVIVVAAGNEGSSNIHLGYTADYNPKKTILNLKNSSNPAIINLWKPNYTSILVKIGIQSDVLTELAETEAFDGNGSTSLPIIHQGKKYAEVYFDSAYYPPSDKVMYLVLINKNCSDCVNSDNEFYIKVAGDTYFDAWFADEDFFSDGSSFSDRNDNGLVPGDSIRTIGMPATSPYVITVAAVVSRKEYIDIDRNVHTLKDNPGDIAYFSSIGPTGDESRTGQKPDIAAPGRIIISAFSSDAIQLQAGTQVDRFHIAMQGTSMACPHIAGVAGLLLSVNPQLTSNEIKRIIRITASKPNDNFSGFDYRWGYGLVDAYESMRMALKIGVCEDKRDCKENMSCVNNYCRGLLDFECESNLDCLSGLVCEDKRCISDIGGECHKDSDCKRDLICVNKECVYVFKGEVVDTGMSEAGCGCQVIE